MTTEKNLKNRQKGKKKQSMEPIPSNSTVTAQYRGDVRLKVSHEQLEKKYLHASSKSLALRI